MTVLFTDVVDSTTLAESMDPEEWTSLMNAAFNQLTPVVTRYEGTIARLMGDALLVLFGAPSAHEDDPIRAVRAGLDLVAAAREYANSVRKEYGVDFAIRVGIHTGNVVVGRVGSDQAHEYTAMGDAVNLASRLQSAARPLSVLISEQVFKQVEGTIEAADMGEIRVKGKTEPVHAYMVERIRPQNKTGKERISREFHPLVGRKNELTTLIQLSQALSAGLGRLAVITGEPGIGKTRLINDWKNSLHDNLIEQNPAILWAEGYCLSYGQGMAYHLLVSLLYSLIGVSPEADPREIQSALTTSCSYLQAAEKDDTLAFLSHLLELPLDPERHEQIHRLDPHSLQGQYRASFYKLTRSLSDNHPLHIILDDLQWADPSSIEILTQLLPLVFEHSLLFCCLSRPDRESPGWKMINAARELMGSSLIDIVLVPLSREESLQIATNLLEVVNLPVNLNETILTRTDGNPLFIEELIYMLVDQGVLVRQNGDWITRHTLQDMEIPNQLQGLLLARIDRLPDETRQLVRLAAVIGRQFSYTVLERVLQNIPTPTIGVKPASTLNNLESSGLIRLRQVQPDLGYEFRHSLVQEAIYDSILRTERKRLHAIVANTLENLYQDQKTEQAPILARHYQLAGENSKAIEYFILSADTAFSRFANSEAITYYSQALQIGLGQSSDAKSLESVYSRLGRAQELNSQYQEAQETYREMEIQADRLQNTHLKLSALIAQATLAAIPNFLHDAHRAMALSQHALKLARELNDRAAEAKIYWILALTYSRSNRIFSAAKYGKKSLHLAHELGLEEQKAFTLNDLGEIYFSTGHFNLARKSFQDVQRLWRELGNLHMLTDSLATSTLMYYLDGEFEQSIQKSDEAFEISKTIGNLWGQAYSRMYVANVYQAQGNPAIAIATLEECIQTAEKAGFLAPLVSTRADLAYLYAYIGWFDRADSLVELALETAKKQFSDWVPWVTGDIVRIDVLKGDLDRAQENLKEVEKAITVSGQGSLALTTLYSALHDFALARFDYEKILEIREMIEPYIRRGIRIFLPELYYGQGICLLVRDNLQEAEKYLQMARTAAENLGMNDIRWMIYAALSRLMTHQGQSSEARYFGGLAHKILDTIADQARVPGFNTDFRSLARVRQVMDGIAGE